MLDPTFAAAHPIAGSAAPASAAAPAGALSALSDGLEAFDAFLWGPWLLIPLLLGTGAARGVSLPWASKLRAGAGRLLKRRRPAG